MGYIINLLRCETCGEGVVPGERYCKKHLKSGEKMDAKKESNRIFDESLSEEPEREETD